MHHIAIMKKSWGLTQKILTGQKTIESRWYKARYAPWDKIRVGDTVYFKDSGEPVTIKATVVKVIQFSELTPDKVNRILSMHREDIGIEKEQIKRFFGTIRDKKYCILIFLKSPQKIKPFEVDKTGFGAMSAWISLKNIEQIKESIFHPLQN